MDLEELSRDYERVVKRKLDKYNVLRDMDIFVLDNSIRESTVGALRGHSLENKWEVSRGT